MIHFAIFGAGTHTPPTKNTIGTTPPTTFAFCTSVFFDTATKSRNGLRGGINKVVFEFMAKVYFFALVKALRRLTKLSLGVFCAD